ncbi:hypothetical protein H2201_007728 [Coniosporium apollinis]|uniref:Uncharacterized protein n=2 Tax=Coniosporium TaxID=2810619 RepID=A0ABQ9NL15_9PEZI|nr:hypothetical protein H2199_004134 [Cladosporium sp. JES 115]KAJ9658648.1 hypothetical protein H2201_007728 [Coniosporium apollinis]
MADEPTSDPSKEEVKEGQRLRSKSKASDAAPGKVFNAALDKARAAPAKKDIRKKKNTSKKDAEHGFPKNFTPAIYQPDPEQYRSAASRTGKKPSGADWAYQPLYDLDNENGLINLTLQEEIASIQPHRCGIPVTSFSATTRDISYWKIARLTNVARDVKTPL